MKKSTFFTLAVAAALLAGTSAARAVTSDGHFSVPSLVEPSDTFDFDLFGFNTVSGDSEYLVPVTDTTFGTTTTYANLDLGKYAVTVTSSEALSGTNFVDTITVSAATVFVPSGNNFGKGDVINGIQLDIGIGGDTLDYLTPVTGYTVSGSSIYSAGSNTITLTPSVTTSNNDESVEASEGYSLVDKTGVATRNTASSITFVLTYPATNLPLVPEPSTYAAAAVGALALGTVLLRRNRRPTGL